MKKALIALAVLGAASGAAVAQSSSSVTLYGVADIAVGKAASSGEQKWGAESNSIVTNGTSRIGLKGTEDLGGGSWAGFNYEGAVNLATGAANANMWDRAAWVGIGNSSFGSVFLGRKDSPDADGQGTYELTGWANYSVLSSTFGYGANPSRRVNAQIEYRTPSFSGASAELAYVPRADGSLVDNGVANQTDHWALNVVYNQGPIKAAITADKSDDTKNGGVANRTNYSAGGSYKFGDSFILSASYNHANSAKAWTNPYGSSGVSYGARRYGWELGGSALLGAFTLTLDLTRDTTNDLYAGHKYTNGLLEGKYALSKRTFLYADYLRLDGNNNYGVGVRHNF